MVKECPYCGGKIFYTKERFFGSCNYFFTNDKDYENEVENYEMYDGAVHNLRSKYVYCKNCEKKLYKIDENYNEVIK